MSFYSEFADYYDAVFPYEPGVYSVLRGLVRGPRGHVLDIGCGTGAYCGALADEGLEVVGVDVDPWMIERASERHRGPDFRVLGMEQVGSLGGSFDLIYCIGNVASHLRREALPGFVESVKKLVSAHGIWLLGTVNWDFILTLSEYDFPEIRVPGTGLTFQRRYDAISKSGTVFSTRLLNDDREVFAGSTTLFPVRSREYVRFHTESGFRLLAHFADFDGSPFSPDRRSSSVLVFGK